MPAMGKGISIYSCSVKGNNGEDIKKKIRKRQKSFRNNFTNVQSK